MPKGRGRIDEVFQESQGGMEASAKTIVQKDQ
jgi:hypothetical protein